MSKLATRGRKESGVLAGEYTDIGGFCRETVTVTMQATMDVGAVLHKVAGKYVWVDNASVATLSADVAILIDCEKDVLSLTPGDQSLVVLLRGPAAIVDIGMQFKDTVTAPNKLLVQAAFKKLNILTRTGV